ncbi:MAG: hypothetical protein ACI396_05360 [Acutalibacteraceae bacterium]
MPQDKLNELRRLVSEIDLLKSEINQRLDTMERKQRELERMLCELDGNPDSFAGDTANAAAAANADNPVPEQPSKQIEPKADDFEKTSHKLDGNARRGKMSSLLEKYSN